MRQLVQNAAKRRASKAPKAAHRADRSCHSADPVGEFVDE